MRDWVTPARWEELEPLLDAALERPSTERAAFVAEAAGSDATLRQELEALLQDADRMTELPLLDRTAGEVFASLFGDDSELVARIFAEALGGRYTILRRIGAGGMATVYLAHDVRHDREVAVKILHPDLAASLGSSRFLAEIRTTARLQHPHLLPLLDSGEAGGQLFYVMPYVKGESLRARLDAEQQLPIEEAVRIAREIAGALDYAHRHGVIHRDIKPENVLLHEGQALVADWGIALATSAAHGRRQALAEIPVGTPQYMSPEQARGDGPVDARSDIHALGCVLYEMLTGDPPFTGSTTDEILGKVRTQRPAAPTAVRETVSPALEAATLKALAKLPADRFSSAAQFASALATEVSVPARALRPHTDRRNDGSSRRLVLGLATVATVLAVMLGVVLLRPETAQPVSRLRLALPAGQGIVSADAPRFALSPDGSALAYVGPGPVPGSRQLWVKKRDQLSGVPLDGTADAEQPVFSPDGRRLAFYVQGQNVASVRVVAIDGGAPVTLVTTTGIAPSQASVAGFRAHGLAWGTDGYIYMDGEGGWGPRRIRASGGEVERAAVRDSVHGLHWWPDPLPGGKAVLVTLGRWNSPVSAYRVGVTDPVTGTTRVLVDGTFARYAASGHLLYITGAGVLMAAPFDARRAVLTGPAFTVLEGLDLSPFGGAGLSVSRHGMLAYLPGLGGMGNTPMWVTREGVATAIDAADPHWRADFSYGVSLSPDGSRLAYADYGQDGRREILVRHLPNGPLVPLTLGAGGSRPAWLDDRTVVFTARRDGRVDLWAQPGDGSGPAVPVIGKGLPIQEFSTVRATPWVALRTVSPNGNSDLVAIRPGVDTAPLPLLTTPFEERVPTLAPNGRFLAYISTESGRQEVYVRPFPDVLSGRWQVSTNGGNAPLWSRNGSELFYVSEGNLVAAAVDTRGAFRILNQRVLFSLRDYTGSLSRGYDEAPDGRFVMFRRGSGPVQDLVLVENFFAELKALSREEQPASKR